MTSQGTRITVFLSGCFLKFLKLGILKSLGVLFVPVQENLQISHVVLGTCMSAYSAAAEIVGKYCDFVYVISEQLILGII